MRTEIIPFKSFMNGYSKPKRDYPLASISAPYWIEERLDQGLLFFGGMGVVFLGFIFLERQGFEINEGLVRLFLWGGLLVYAIWAVHTTPFFRSLIMGF